MEESGLSGDVEAPVEPAFFKGTRKVLCMVRFIAFLHCVCRIDRFIFEVHGVLTKLQLKQNERDSESTA